MRKRFRGVELIKIVDSLKFIDLAIKILLIATGCLFYTDPNFMHGRF